jgi:hypothetical protein
MDALLEAEGRLVAAGQRRDRAALIEAAEAYVEAAVRWPSQTYHGEIALFTRMGALLLAGRSRSFAAAMREHLHVKAGGEDRVPIGVADESAVEAYDLRSLFLLRLYEGRYEPILRPGLYIPASAKPELRRMDRLMAAFAARDGAVVVRAVDALAREDPAPFSVFRYALYDQARAAGIEARIPRAFAF